MALGAGPLHLRNVSFPGGRHDPGDESQYEKCRHRERHGVAAYEPAKLVAERCGARDDRKPFQVAADVGIELLDRGIAVGRRCLQRLAQDRIQIRVGPVDNPGQNHCEGIHIARGADRLAASLFGAGVLRGQGNDVGKPFALIEQARNPEVQQTYRACLGHQHVAALQVAVNHQVLMHVLHGRAQRTKQLEPGTNRQFALPAELVDRHPADVIHYQVRQPVGSSSVEQPGDVRMVEVRQNLHLDAQPLL